jgi:hypothetical protein
MSLEFLNKSHPNKKEILLLLGKQTPISRALLGISFGVPNKGALPPAAVLTSALNFPTRQEENIIPKRGIKSERDV